MTDTQFSNEEGVVVFHNTNALPYIAVPHLHSQYEICYNVEGGKGFLAGGELYRLGRRDLILIPKVVAHKVLVVPGAKYERCIININDETVARVETACGAQMRKFLTGCEHPQVVSLCEAQHERLLSLIRAYNEKVAESEGDDRVMRLGALLAFLRDAFATSVPADPMVGAELSYADRVFFIIEKSFATVSVAQIAEQLYLNEDHICRVFKKETGVTIKHYLTKRKLAEAKKYLYLGYNVREAGVLSGFHDYANFIRTFKKYEGYSPGNMEGLEKPI